MTRPLLSVCIVTSQRHEALRRCLASLASQEGAPGWELLIAADDDGEVEAVLASAEPTTVIHTLGRTLGSNRNLLIDRASGRLLVFFDDDVQVPPGFLAAAARVAEAAPDVAVFGGPNLTPVDANRFAQVQGRLLGTPWLTGPMSRRYRPLPAPSPTGGSGLTLCNLVVRSDAKPWFPADQRGGEENAMLASLRRNGHQMLLHPDLTVAHERRADLPSFARQLHKYGYGRGELLRAQHCRCGILVAVAGAAVTALVAIRRRQSLAGTAAITGAASLCVLTAAWRASPDDTHRPSDVAQAGAVPLAYGWGVAAGALGWRRHHH